MFATHGTTSFTYTGVIADTTVDPYVGQSSLACSYTGTEGECTSWDETFGESIALSGNGEVAMLSDQSEFDSSDSADFTIDETADIYTATEEPDGTFDWSFTPDDVTGADVETQYVREDDGVECATSPHCQYEDFGTGMALDQNGDTAFVGDPSHDNDSGAVYVFHNSPNPAVTGYEQVAELEFIRNERAGPRLVPGQLGQRPGCGRRGSGFHGRGSERGWQGRAVHRAGFGLGRREPGLRLHRP